MTRTSYNLYSNYRLERSSESCKWLKTHLSASSGASRKISRTANYIPPPTSDGKQKYHFCLVPSRDLYYCSQSTSMKKCIRYILKKVSLIKNFFREAHYVCKKYKCKTTHTTSRSVSFIILKVRIWSLFFLIKGLYQSNVTFLLTWL